MLSLPLPAHRDHRDVIMEQSLAPLPTPPLGYHWVKENKDWRLVDAHGNPLPVPAEGTAVAKAVASYAAVDGNVVAGDAEARSMGEEQVHSEEPLPQAVALPPGSGANPTVWADCRHGNRQLNPNTRAGGSSLCSALLEHGNTQDEQTRQKAAGKEGVPLDKPATPPEFYEHLVVPRDTFQGLCLRYRVKAHVLRKHNGLSSDCLRGLEVVRIPTDRKPTSSAAAAEDDLTTNAAAVQKLRRLVPGLGSIEAKLYLEDHEYSVTKALEAWKADEEWEKVS